MRVEKADLGSQPELRFQYDEKRFRLSKDPEENRLAGMNRFEDFAKFPHGGHLDPIDFPDNVSFS